MSAIVEDDHGVLWLATAKAGLLQYNFESDKFAVFLRQPNNNLGLQYNYQINAIFQDREENIWLATDKGISIFNPYRQYFTALNTQDIGRPSMALNEISGVLMTARNELWAADAAGGEQTRVRLEVLSHNLIKTPSKIAISTMEGLLFFDIDDIIHIEAKSNYTVFSFLNRPKLTVSKTLKEFEELLPANLFFRPHHSHIIHLQYVKRYIKGDGGQIELQNGEFVDVSRKKKDDFLKLMGL